MMGKTKTINSVDTSRAKVGTLIGQGAVFEGNITVPETARIDGTINGDCHCEENLILGPQGQIIGDITAQNMIISGTIQGDVSVSGKLEILSTGKLTGNITAKSLVIDEEAYFDGRCTMTTTPANEPPSSSKENDSSSDRSSSKKEKKVS